MNHKLKRKWVNTLRSGTYIQGRGCLCSRMFNAYLEQDTRYKAAQLQPARYCVLGVLAIVANVPLDQDHIYDKLSSLMDFSACHLMGLNDTHKYTFDMLADFIEEHL